MELQLVNRETIELLRLQRARLQANILDPLHQIKEKIGRRLQRKEVQLIKSFLTKDIERETLEKASDVEALLGILDLYYGEDNLKFIGQLLSKACCEDLVEMLQQWMSNNKTNPSMFYNFGFFPLWIKVNYNFNEFSKNRSEIFNILKRVFAIPSLHDDHASHCTIYMGVSLGKRDVLICVLVPYCVRHNIRTSLEKEDITLQLRKAHITGIYFSRIKGKSRSTSWSHKNNLAGSDSSITSTISSDFGDLFEPAYVETNDGSNTKHNELYQHSSNPQDHPQPQSVIIQTYHNANSMKDEELDQNGNYKGSEALILHNSPKSMDSCYQAVHGERSSASTYRDECDGTKTHIVPKLARANYGYIEVSNNVESTSKALQESDKPSYGACIFVDHNFTPRTVYSHNHGIPPTESAMHVKHPCDHVEPSVYEDPTWPLLTKPVPHSYSVGHSDIQNLSNKRHFVRNSPVRTGEQRRTEFCFEESKKFYSDDEEELKNWNRKIINHDSHKTDEDPSFWYQPKKSEINNLQAPSQPAKNTLSKFTIYSAGAQRNSEERTSNLPNKQDTNKGYLLSPSYWREDERDSSCHVDTFAYHNNHKYPSNHLDYEFSRVHEDEQRYGWLGEYSGKDHIDYLAPTNHRDVQDQCYCSNSTIEHGGQFHRFNEAEPEQARSSITSRLSAGLNGQPAGVFVRQSTPNSSSSTLSQADKSVNLTSDKMSTSMPSLHAKQNDNIFDAPRRRWSHSRDGSCHYANYRQQLSKYQSEDDIEDKVFVNTYKNSVKVSPPPYCSPPDYQETMVRKSYFSLSSVSLESKRVKARYPLLSSQSVSSIYKEKELLLSRKELQETIRSAEEKQWEILLEKSKEFLIAVKMGDEEEVENLLEEDIDVDYKNEFGQTALMVASREGHLDVIQVLIAHRADMNIQDKYGKSALHEAAWSGQHQVINALLSSEADINCVDEEGRTPLQYASLRGKTKVAEILLCFGADSSILNKDGESAVEIAYRCHHKDIVKLLLKSTDKKTRKSMKGKIRKQKFQHITSATSLPNISQTTSMKTVTPSRSKPDVNKRACVTQ